GEQGNRGVLMGLDATVMCNCFRDGKATPPPFPREWLEVDNEGYLNLKNEHASNQTWAGLHAWERSCCEHEGMDFVCEHISNWTPYRQFQEALGEVGWQRFPVLKEQGGKQIPWEDGSWQKPDGQCRFEYPSEFHVEQRPWLVADFDFTVKALRTVFDASV